MTETKTERKQRGRVDRTVMFPAPPKVQLPKDYPGKHSSQASIQSERLRRHH